MARSAGGTVLDEPSPGSRRGRRQARPERSQRRGAESEGREGGGARQERRQAAERRRFWFVLMPGVAALLVLTVAVGAVIRDDDGDANGSGNGGAGAGAGQVNTLLLSHRAPDGRLDLLVLTNVDGDEGAVLLLPVATQVEVPSLGPQALADIPNDGDAELLPTTVENLLGVRVVNSLTLDDAALTAALSHAAPIPADLSRAVQFDEATGELFAAGSTHLTAEDATQLLVRAQPVSELDRLVTVQDVLEGWMRRLRNPRVARATVAATPELAALVAVARAEDVRTDSLPVESITTADGERFDPRIEDLALYVSSAFGNARLGGSSARPRVEILNGTGAVGLAQSIAGDIVSAGGQVTLTGNVTNFGVEETQVVYYRDADRADAERLLDALDCGALKKAERELQVVDVTIVAGADCFGTGTSPGT
jgi:hypothetical protein